MTRRFLRQLAIAFSLLIVGFVVAGDAADFAAAASPGVAKVYWTDRDNATLSVTDVTTLSTTVLVSPTGGRLQDVDLDSSTGILYYADWGPVGPPGGQGSINRVNKDGTGQATVLGTRDAVHQLALDEASQTIYFTRAVSYDGSEISKVSTSGAGYTQLASPIGWFPSGLAVDTSNSLLYWGDIGVLNFPPNGSVNRMTTAGVAPTQLTPHVDGRGRGFALDAASQTIFLTSHDPLNPSSGGAVFRYDIITDTETQLIPSVGADPSSGYWDIQIDPVSQRIWWTAPNAGEIRSAKLDGTDAQVELSGLTNPYGLALELVTEADLEVGKSCPATAPAGSDITCTVTVTNMGPADATDVELEDVVVGGTIVSATASPAGTCGPPPPPNTPSTICDLGTLDAGDSVTIVIVIDPASNVAGATVCDTATASADQPEPTPDPNPNTATACTTVVAGPPATLTLAPKTATNPVDDEHCVTATVTDAFGNPLEGVIVRFKVAGSVNTTGSVATDEDGQAQFCYTGPALPGSDVITAFADTDGDGTQDPGEPSDTASKTWVIPASTEGCEVTYGGRITAANGDKGTFGGNATAPNKGQEEYQDHGPAININVKAINVLAVVCTPDKKSASIFGKATVNGAGSFDYRIDLKDLGEPGTNDTYRIRLSNGYDSGEQKLNQGNVQIHK